MHLLIRITLLLSLLYLSCAHQMAPPGGPKDELPPNVIKTEPESGTLNHPVKKKILLVFSEWVDVRNLKKSITVFPTLPDGFKVDVAGRKVEIAPKTAFAESTTYHIGINTVLTDLHGVSIGTPYKFFFSTGSSIDSGIVYGCVIDTKSRNIQPKVALFRCDRDTLPDTALINLPSYLIQTDSLGIFSFEHIRKGTYNIIAFIDNNNNNRLTPGEENAYAPLEKKFILELEAGPFVLFPASSDTLSVTVVSIKAISSTLISGEWTEGTVSTMAGENANWSIISLDSSVKAPAIEEYIAVSDSRRFALKLSDSLTTGSYSLIYRINPRISYFSENQDSSDTLQKVNGLLLDTIRFNGTVITDTVAPVFKGAWPKNIAALDTRVKLNWSKPVKITACKWYIADTLGDSVELTADTSFSEINVLKLLHRLLPGRYYSMSIPTKNFEDFNGNNPKVPVDTSKTDTLETDTAEKDTIPSISVEFTTVAARKLCHSLSGGASCLEPDSLRIWEYKQFGSAYVHSVNDSSNQFRFDSIPAGKGTISYFVDYNRDGEYTLGSLFPWKPPEPYFAFTDTIEARARWDIEGIEVPACDICTKMEHHSETEGKSPDEKTDELKRDRITDEEQDSGIK